MYISADLDNTETRINANIFRYSVDEYDEKKTWPAGLTYEWLAACKLTRILNCWTMPMLF